MGMSLEEMYKLALNPKIYPTDRLLKIMQGQDTSLPMAVAMSAKQMRDKQTTALKGAQAKAQGAQPSVKDRMLAQGMQQEMAGLDQLPAPTMEGMGDVAMGAGGGLVSFASGGFNSEDAEDAEQDDHDELTAMAARYGDLGGLGAGIMSVANPKAAKYSSFTSVAKPAAAAPVAGNFKDIAAEATKKHGASWDLVQHVMHKETGGHKDPANAVSKAGATGVMQLMPRTAKELGVKNINDPYENINGGVRYIAQLEQKYKDPKLAAMAYNWGPGNVDKWLKRGGNEKSLPKETRMYVASLAQGGIVGLKGGSKEPVKGDDEGYFLPPIEAEDTEMGRDIQLLKTRAKNVGVDIKKATKDFGSGITGYFGKSAPGTYNEQPPQLRTPMAAPPVAAPTNTNAPGIGAPPPAGPMTPPPAAVNPFETSQKRVDDYLAGLTQQRKQDQGISAILTGLTTAGTAGPLTSALKTGAQTGLGYYGDAQKGYNAAMAQGLGAQSALDRNRVYQEMYGNKLENAQGLKYDTMLAGLDKVAEDRIKNMTKFGNFDLNKPEQRQKAINQIKYEMISANPNLKKHYLESTGLDELGFKKIFNPGLLSDTPVGTVRTLPK
jgi:hypothetical protein